ncbi:Uma2 family endonuclease [Crocosphaera sp. XPORK-15E]|uniref:Uma2 family endonuclease n=1 Tax=Crocosphaera sp. XPORK-15E TaxID=3110247 RepID=UPI002B2015A9|nr:Uma2 family endonuclease [Crocosphaera sp. XPORK-15E]MEA5534793.1 Uma2 family endonuclease [Crocosphaera sp. XPORK-15E]
MNAITLNLNSIIQMTDEQFYQLCENNRELRFERNKQGELIIMSPTGGGTGKRNFDINFQLGKWHEQKQLGVFFDSSTGFKLPNGADRSPDVAWIPTEKWNCLTQQQQEKFIPLCPDFIIELRSPSDQLKTLQEKMQEYIDNGTRLGWLINRQDKQVEIYRQGQAKEVLDNPNSLSGENILPDFILILDSIW